jgi:hypothetical protein
MWSAGSKRHDVRFFWLEELHIKSYRRSGNKPSGLMRSNDYLLEGSTILKRPDFLFQDK